MLLKTRSAPMTPAIQPTSRRTRSGETGEMLSYRRNGKKANKSVAINKEKLSNKALNNSSMLPSPFLTSLRIYIPSTSHIPLFSKVFK